jgi:hypothetical protein
MGPPIERRPVQIREAAFLNVIQAFSSVPHFRASPSWVYEAHFGELLLILVIVIPKVRSRARPA